MSMNQLYRAMCIASLGLALTSAAWAQSGASAYPERAIKIVVPFAPGGSTDVVARVIGKQLGEELKQAVVIDNRPGANTVIGTEIVAKSPADGYTLVMATNNHTSNVSMYRKLPYDTEKAFTSVALLGWTPNLIAVNAKVGERSLKDLVAAARVKPDAFSFATAGHGTTQHFTGELLNQLAKTRMTHVGYKGGGPAATDVIAGHVPILISGLPPAMPFIKNGALRPVAVTSAKRSAILPDVPTVAESGYPGFDATFWFAILVPAGTPAAIVATLNSALNTSLKNAEVQKQLAQQGVEIEGGGPADLDAFLKADTKKWADLVQTSGIKLLD